MIQKRPFTAFLRICLVFLAVITLGCSQQEQDTVSTKNPPPPLVSAGDEKPLFAYMGLSDASGSAPIYHLPPPQPQQHIGKVPYVYDTTLSAPPALSSITPSATASNSYAQPPASGYASSWGDNTAESSAAFNDDNWRPATLENSEGIEGRALRSKLEGMIGGGASPGSRLSSYLSQSFFNHQAAALSPDASMRDRVQGELSGMLLSSLQRQAEQQTSSTVDALFAGDEVDGLLEEALASLQVGLANDAINRGLDGLRGLPGASFQNLEGEFIVRKGQAPEYALTTIQPIYESPDEKHTFFSQISARTQDDDHTGNLGFAYRRMSDDRKYLIGANTFLDYELPDDHARMSIGLDAMTSLLSVNVNRYWPLTGWRDTANGYQERGMAGWDGGVTGRLEKLPDIQLAARTYLWERDGAQGNLTGAEAGFDYSPVPAFKFGLRAGRDTDEDFTLTSTMGFRWLFGMDAQKQLSRNTLSLDDVGGRRYEKVQRENRILKQTRQNPALTARVTSTVGANTAQRPDGSTVSLAVGQQLPFGTRVNVANSAGAIAELAFGNGATLILGQDTDVRIDQNNITLFQGIMRFISGGTDITINIPGGTISLLGTDIDVRSYGTQTTARVRDGNMRVEANGGTQDATIGETVEVNGGSPAIIPFASPEAELHRNEAHAKLDRAGNDIIALPKASPYVTGTPAIQNFSGSTFDIVMPFSKPVNVAGAPVLHFSIGGVPRTATYSSGSGSIALAFSYTSVGADAGFNQIVMDSMTPEGSIVTAGNSAQRATLTILPETVTLPGTIGGGGVAPTITTITPNGTLTSDDPIVFTVTFSEAVTGFDASDPVVSNGSVASVGTISTSQYTVSVTPAADGAVTLTIPANSVVNGASVGNAASATVSVTSDRTPPSGYTTAFTGGVTVTSANQNNISIDVDGAEVGAMVSYSITSSGGGTAVSGSIAAPAANFSIAGLDLSGLGDGTLTVTVMLADLAGNIGGSVTSTTTKSTTAVTASVSTAVALTNANPIVFDIVFSEAVSGLDAGDFVVVNGTAAAPTTTDNIAWQVNITPSVDGTVSVQVSAGAATNGVGTPNLVSNTATTQSDRSAPTGQTVSFVPAVINTANAAAADVSLANLEVGATYSLSITSSGGGTAVTSNGTAGAASIPLTLDLSGLNDGTLTAVLVMTDPAGNIAAAVNNTVTKTTAAALPTAMTGPSAGSYTATDTLDFTITYASALTVSGTPRIALDMGGSTVYATYTGGSGTTTLSFSYTVVAPNAANPLAFAATAIDLNSGSIIDTATSNAVNTDFTAVAPVLTGVIVDTAPPAGYSVAFDNPVNGANETAAPLTISGLEVGATYALNISSDNGGTPVTNTNTVTAATMPLTLDLSGLADGTLTASLTLTDTAGNAGAAAASNTSKSTTSVTALVSTAATLTNASPIVFSIAFSEAVTGFTASDLVVVNGTAAAPTTADNITWQANVTPAADGTVSVQVSAGAVTNGIGTPNLASNTATTQSDRSAPTGQTVSFVPPVINTGNASTAGVSLANLEIGAAYSLSITSSGGGTAVTSSGTAAAASVPLTLDLSGLGDGTLTAVLVMTDSAGNMAASVNSTVTKTTTAPAVSAMTAPANAYYNAPDVLTFTVTFNQAVSVSGTPRLALNMNGTTVYANYASGSTTATLTFTTTLTAGQTANPLAFAATTIDLNGGTIAATTSGNTAAIDFTAVAPIVSSIFVDTTAPTLNSITPPNNRVYVTGEAIFFTLTFSEPMVVTGTPRLALTYGATTIYANYASGNNTPTIGFSYVVQAGDVVPAGLTIANAVDLNGGTILDRATNPPAALTFTAPNLNGVQMNVPSCAGGTVQLGASFLDGFCAGKVNIGGSDFDLIVAPSGCGYESGGNSSSVPSGIFTPACSGTDSVTKIWADSNGATENASFVEDGITNTVNAINDGARQNPAIAYCYNLNVNGRIDWYLPSRNELDALRQNLGAFGLLGFANTTYWSSTETGASAANIYDMAGGLSAVSKTNAHHVRCVRRITPPQIALNPNPADGRINTPYTATIAATGGGGALTFTLVSGTLPPGLALDAATGVISGTPTAAGVYPGLVVRASDTFGQSETNPFSITITGLPQCNSNTVDSGTAYGGGVCVATVTIGAETFDMVATPSNCAFETSGSATTKPLADFTPTCNGATDSVTKRWSSSTGFNEQALSNTDGIGNTLQLRYDSQTANAAAAYCYHLNYGGYTDWYLPAREEAQALRDNMYANNVGGLAATTYQTSTQSTTSNSIVIDLINNVVTGGSKTSAYRTRCVRRVNAPLRIVQPAVAPPAGAEGLAYSVTFSASGGTGAISYSVVAGTLPPGVTLDSGTGVISGTPTLAGAYSGIVIRATDAASATADTPPQTITVTGLARCNGGTVTAGAAYGGGICAGEVPNGGSPYDLVATVSRCALEPGGSAGTEPVADFTPACTGAADNVTKSWADAATTNETATSTNGLANTQYLVGDARRLNAAAAYCYHLVHGGYNDWYLPSREELDVLYDNLADKGLGNFAAANYASSTQSSSTQNRYRSFATGASGGTTKTTAQNLRCVRRANPPTPLLLQTALTPPDGSTNITYRMRVPVSSSAGALTFSLSAGTLPPGLTLNTATGYITGIPTTAGTYGGIVIGVTDGATSDQTAAFSITIVEVDACDNGNVLAGSAHGGGICVGAVTIGAENYDLVATPGNCSFETSGSSTTSPTNNFTPTCSGATDALVTKRWTIGTALSEGATSTSDGVGNTLQVATDDRRDNPAVSYCENMVYGGFDDWYLPAREELLAMYSKLSSKSLGSFANATYWSATESTTANAINIQMTTGVAAALAKTSTSVPRVRCVRRTNSPLRITANPILPEGHQNIAFSHRIRASGGSGALTFSLTGGSLPAGITLNSTTGAISGTTTTAGTFSGLVVSVTDGSTTVSSNPFSLVIVQQAECTGGVLAGAAYSGGICGGTVNFGGLPYDLVLSPSGCGNEPSGSATTKASANFTPTCSGGVDTTNKRWGSLTSTNEGANSVSNGLANTLQLLSDAQSANAAAAYCFYLNVGGFDDWYLPAEDEVEAIYQNLGRWSLGGLAVGSVYVSSTEASSANARMQTFDKLGTHSSTAKTTTTTRVRCVRKN